MISREILEGIRQIEIRTNRKARYGVMLWGALVLGARLAGGFTSPTTDTQILSYSNNRSAIAGEYPVLRLGKIFSIKEAADSWAQLVQKCKPAFAWNGRDMMWIEADGHGKPQFRLDEAYVYQPANQPCQWVLLRQTTNSLLNRGESPQFFWSNQNLEGSATLRDSVPEMHDGGYHGDFAVEKASHPQYGTVYEVGWQRRMGEGTGHPEYCRRIYVLRDRHGKWHFLGEGPEEGAERGRQVVVASNVVWENSAADGLPLQVRFHCKEFRYPYNYNETSVHVTVVTTNDYVLAGKFPAQLRKLK